MQRRVDAVAGGRARGRGQDAVPLDELAALLATLPGVVHVVADEASGAPEAAWGNQFFSAHPDDAQPFATLVDRDVPGWDEDSALHRPGVYRLNVHVGRERFERLFGYPSARIDEHREGIDFTALDRVLPHPTYARQGWACVLGPTRGRMAEVEALLREAHEDALRRRDRRARPGV